MSPDTIAPHETAADDPATRPPIALLAGRHRRAENGHPWIYSNEVAMDAAAKALAPGSLVTLRRADSSPLGVAMFNPHTLLAARLLDRDTARPIGRRFLARRIGRALKLRERLFDLPFSASSMPRPTGCPVSLSTGSGRFLSCNRMLPGWRGSSRPSSTRSANC